MYPCAWRHPSTRRTSITWPTKVSTGDPGIVVVNKVLPNPSAAARQSNPCRLHLSVAMRWASASDELPLVNPLHLPSRRCDAVDGRLRSCSAHEPDSFSCPAAARDHERALHADYNEVRDLVCSRMLTVLPSNRSAYFYTDNFAGAVEPCAACNCHRYLHRSGDTAAALRAGDLATATRSSRAGTASCTMRSGGRSRPSTKVMPTAIRRPWATRRGNR